LSAGFRDIGGWVEETVPQALIEHSRNPSGRVCSPLCGGIEDLGPGDLVKVDSAVCHHVALLAPEALLRVGLSPAAKILDLKGRFRCRGCGKKGRAVVSIKWRGQGAGAALTAPFFDWTRCLCC
jgi:hypothetical protein